MLFKKKRYTYKQQKNIHVSRKLTKKNIKTHRKNRIHIDNLNNVLNTFCIYLNKNILTELKIIETHTFNILKNLK